MFAWEVEICGRRRRTRPHSARALQRCTRSTPNASAASWRVARRAGSRVRRARVPSCWKPRWVSGRTHVWIGSARLSRVALQRPGCCVTIDRWLCGQHRWWSTPLHASRDAPTTTGATWTAECRCASGHARLWCCCAVHAIWLFIGCGGGRVGRRAHNNWRSLARRMPLCRCAR